MWNNPPSFDAAAGQYKLGIAALMASITAAALVGYLFHDGIGELLRLWEAKEEYSHAYLLPALTAFLIWQKKNEILAKQWSGSWVGVIVTLFGLSIFFLGSLAAIYAVVHYALVFTIAGLVLSFVGVRNLRFIWAGLALLFFAIPFPQFLYQALSTKLQLLSSEIGVGIIRTFGVSVFLEGNVIDLGSYKLQVVEACNGLRYLFPLASFGFICAYLYKGPVWQKIIIFISTAPITVFMNSLRIGVIGFTVDRWGQEMAEGFLHDFEGWAIFMACLAILFIEIAVFARLQRPKRSFADAFFVEIPESVPKLTGNIHVPRQYLVSIALIAVAVLVGLSIEKRREIIPARLSFSEFPMEISGWRGHPEVMEQVYIDILKFTDYLLVNYQPAEEQPPVNFYVAYYESQRAGESAHSPRACIPGGGWKIQNLTRLDLRNYPTEGHQQPVNRVEIVMGENKQLVYYWFQQRGRLMTNEYLVKWFLLWDSLTKRRTDGALVRITTFIPPGESWATGDMRLQSFLNILGPTLESYVPN